MKKQFDILKKVRTIILKVIDGLTMEQLNTIPLGFNNNIAWNFAHLVVTQQILCYKLSGLECYIDNKSILKYKKGSAPEPDVKMTDKEFLQFKELFVSYPLRLEEDYKNGLFKEFEDYNTSAGVSLTCIEDAISFNGMHEGIHLGSILALKRLTA